MRTVAFGVDSRDAFSARIVAAMKGEPQGARSTFESIDLLLETLTSARWAVLKMMIDAGPQSVRRLACRADRDEGTLRRDEQALLNVAVPERQADSTVVFLYDNVHVHLHADIGHEATFSCGGALLAELPQIER